MFRKIHSNTQLQSLEKDSMTTMDKLIKDKSLSEKAYDTLCDMIMEMRPGRNRLPSEDDLARTMGVSRATIREALKHLMMDGIITTLHGKGTFAHPSVFSAEGRMDLYSDFGLMLSKRYQNVEVETECHGFQPPSELFNRLFGCGHDTILSYGWTYRAERRPMLYCQFEICPEYIVREVERDATIKSLPQFSAKYMQSPIDYCIMNPQIRSSVPVQEKLELHNTPYLLCWEERIFDIEDRMVAAGTVYVHPTNMELSVVTRFEI